MTRINYGDPEPAHSVTLEDHEGYEWICVDNAGWQHDIADTTTTPRRWPDIPEVRFPMREVEV